jgi:hypothetical protein
MLIPDFVYSLIYASYHFSNLVREEADVGPNCSFLAFLTVGCVLATFMGPVTVSYVPYRYLRETMTKSAIHYEFPKSQLVVMLVIPWVLGFIIAGAMYGSGFLGSYRGLYCYSVDLDNIITGAVVTTFWLLALIFTIVIYSLIHQQMKQSKRNTKNVVRKAQSLIFVLFTTWSVFCISGIMALAGVPPPIAMESLGAILISFQSIIDSRIVNAHFHTHRVAQKGSTIGRMGSKNSNRDSNRGSQLDIGASGKSLEMTRT